MKKLLILAAVIVAGVAANAASFKWSAANVYGADGEKFTGTADVYGYLTSEGVSTAVKVATASVTTGTLAYTGDWADATGGQNYTFYFVIEDGGKEFNSYSASVTKAGTAQATSTVTIGFGNMTTATKTNAASNWAAVPEPTSGLLMLLGIAGLALKRKRA